MPGEKFDLNDLFGDDPELLAELEAELEKGTWVLDSIKRTDDGLTIVQQVWVPPDEEDSTEESQVHERPDDGDWARGPAS
jgi:hypothetical protein